MFEKTLKSKNRARLAGQVEQDPIQALHEKEHSQEIDFRLMNRRIREPYVRWCERRTPVVRNRSRLLN